MRRAIAVLLIAYFISALVGCSEIQPQATIPEIEFVTVEGQQCPQLVISVGDGDAVIDTINEEMKARFMAFIPRSADGAARDDVTVHTFVSLTDTVISVLLKQEFEMVYGTDGAAWSICYDYRDKMIVPCGAYLSSQGYFYSEICEKIWKLLLETSTYEKVNIPCFYFDSNSNLILVVEALEHPSGADPWNRIYYYSVSEDSFVSSPIDSEQDFYIEHPVVDPTDIASLPT